MLNGQVLKLASDYLFVPIELNCYYPSQRKKKVLQCTAANKRCKLFKLIRIRDSILKLKNVHHPLTSRQKRAQVPLNKKRGRKARARSWGEMLLNVAFLIQHAIHSGTHGSYVMKNHLLFLSLWPLVDFSCSNVLCHTDACMGGSS